MRSRARAGCHFPGWRELLPEYLTRLDAGTGAFQALVNGRGADVERADLEFNASGVVVHLSDRPNAVMDQVSGALSLAHTADRWTLAGRRLRVIAAGRKDPDSEFEASWRENPAGMLELHAEANYLRAEALLPLVGLMPQKDIRERLRDLAPTGEWSDMRLTLARASASEAWRFDARAKFRDMGFAPVGHAPGLRGLSGSLVGSEAAGHLIIDTHSAVYNWPDQFPEPIALPVLKSTLYWRRNPQEVLLATLGSRAAHARGERAREARVVAARRRQLARAHPGELHRRRQRRRCAAVLSSPAAAAACAAMAGSCVRLGPPAARRRPSSRVRCGTFHSATARDSS